MPQRTLRLITESQDHRPIFVAGTFNDWTTEQEAFRMHPTSHPHFYELTLELPEGTHKVEYKYTRGGWEAVELGPWGASTNKPGPGSKHRLVYSRPGTGMGKGWPTLQSRIPP